MIVVDTSAIIAIFTEEADAQLFGRRIASEAAPFIAASSVLECSIVMRSSRRLSVTKCEEWLDGFLESGRVTVEALGLEDLRLARDAHIRFGKGTGHPAQLNFGDCFSYALARRLDAPLLYKGEDFAKTDIRSVL